MRNECPDNKINVESNRALHKAFSTDPIEQIINKKKHSEITKKFK